MGRGVCGFIERHMVAISVRTRPLAKTRKQLMVFGQLGAETKSLKPYILITRPLNISTYFKEYLLFHQVEQCYFSDPICFGLHVVSASALPATTFPKFSRTFSAPSPWSKIAKNNVGKVCTGCCCFLFLSWICFVFPRGERGSSGFLWSRVKTRWT